jgi:hypothetical protein
MKVIETTLALVPTASELFNDRLVPAQDSGSDGLAADDALIGDEPAKLLSPLRELSLTLRMRLRLGKACAIIDTTSPVSHKSNPYSMVFECSSRTPRITNVDMLRAEHDVWKPCCYFLSLPRVCGRRQCTARRVGEPKRA